MRYLPSRKAAEALGVHPNTLRRWADAGKIEHIKTESGQRRYDVDSYVGHRSQPVGVCYCRVSSYKQKDDLERQVAFMQEQHPRYEIIRDIGSGLSFKRKGLRSLLERQAPDYGCPQRPSRKVRIRVHPVSGRTKRWRNRGSRPVSP